MFASKTHTVDLMQMLQNLDDLWVGVHLKASRDGGSDFMA
jgi:hypothetical protein